VAERAGVSKSLVSLVLRNGSNVSAAKRARNERLRNSDTNPTGRRIAGVAAHVLRGPSSATCATRGTSTSSNRCDPVDLHGLLFSRDQQIETEHPSWTRSSMLASTD
jgi:hypothetical protein